MVEILPDDAPAPRLCHLIKWPDFDGYGFNLHAERSNPGQFIGKIDEQSPAELAGLREGDRIIEVNGVNISNENHRQVVERIKSNPQEAKLLVVDPEADAWYRDQDLVVKSSQINVVYIRTPVPRPEPDSPRATNFHGQQQQQQHRASQPQENGTGSRSSSSSQNQQQQQQDQRQESKQQDQQTESAQSGSPGESRQQQHESPSPNQSLETSDFNEDSLEQQQEKRDEPAARRVSPPMSPDSGRGDEDQHRPTPPPPGKPDEDGETLTVEAEINHRPTAGSGADEKRKREGKGEDEEVQADERKTESPLDEKEQIRKLHNKSADSGKSSSPDATSSSSNTSGSHSDLVAASAAAEDGHGDDDRQRPKTSANDESVPSLSSSKLNVDSKTKRAEPAANHQAEVPTETTTKQAPKTEQQAHEPEDTQVNRVTINNNNLSKLDNSNNDDCDDKINPEDSHKEEANLPASAMTKIMTGASHHQKQSLDNGTGNGATNNNNNYSGLNLNMTASQMRELIASRKKFDPKKAQMNIRQKYEIIQQM